MKTEFDDKAATWDDDPIRVARAEAIAAIMTKRIDLNRIKVALEYGSGTGLLSFALKDQLSRIILMDESVKMIEVANKKAELAQLHHISAQQYDLLRMPQPAFSVDMIYILLTLHHIDDTDHILSKFYSLLNKGGYLALIDLEKEDGSFHEGEFHGHHGFERSSLEAKLISTGFKIMSYEVCYTLTRETEEGTREYPLFLLIAKKA